MSHLALGLMSGTSLDGVDAALVRFDGERPGVTLVAFHAAPYDDAFREQLRGAMTRGTARDLALLHVELGRRFADAGRAVLAAAGVAPAALAFVASHGQTIWHEPGVVSLQLGDPAIIAEQFGVPVISDFRSRDVAAGGQGAPLVPVADALLFAAPDRPRILLNVGGMANVTWVPAGGDRVAVRAFDTGPGVAVLDAVTRRMRPGLPFDRDGLLAAAGRPHAATVARLLTHPYFAAPPPKTTGREQFGDAYAAALVRDVRAADPAATDEDCVATALALTVGAIANQIARWLPADGAELIASGGGVRHPVLVARLREAVAPRAVRRFDDVFFDGEAKEAVAFALLGWLRLRGRGGNVPTATGAKGERVLGVVTG
ncbi:MAG: anhydro-N-acetylmuramic acid kinase [Gemmatimonadota bacterium]|nr:anhydro-N-acetylmuramic acid kinase [Gemmatimonadota bacterium]